MQVFQKQEIILYKEASTRAVPFQVFSKPFVKHSMKGIYFDKLKVKILYHLTKISYEFK